jgi:hypothetical protein
MIPKMEPGIRNRSWQANSADPQSVRRSLNHDYAEVKSWIEVPTLSNPIGR